MKDMDELQLRQQIATFLRAEGSKYRADRSITSSCYAGALDWAAIAILEKRDAFPPDDVKNKRDWMP